ncbi:MAG: hypothetical protein MAG451_02395 [Anaerolineales bacterium]|nr:hypothetical protein [Anaerolineales bacterium]
MSQTELQEHDFPPVQQLARLIRRLNREEKAQLLRLVPDLQAIVAEEGEITEEQADVMAYFERKLEALPERRPTKQDDPFVAGLTVGEFFALPEKEQARIWSDVHKETEQRLNNGEHPVQADAVPPR